MKHLKTIMSVMLLVLVFGCSKEENKDVETGFVSFSLSANQILADQTKSAVSQYTNLPNADDFTISITPTSNSTTYTWSGQIAEWDSATMVPVGTYKVVATYGSLEEEGFDEPFFTGETSFTVTATKGDNPQPVEVSIEAELGNAVVLVDYTDNFKNYYSDYTFKLTRDAADIVTFVNGETRGAFIDPYKFKLEGQIIRGNQTKSFSKDYNDLEVRTAYKILFDVANVGSSSITISFNNEVETIELGDLELN